MQHNEQVSLTDDGKKKNSFCIHSLELELTELEVNRNKGFFLVSFGVAILIAYATFPELLEMTEFTVTHFFFGFWLGLSAYFGQKYFSAKKRMENIQLKILKKGES